MVDVQLFRYWLTQGRDWNGACPTISIRIEWTDNAGVVRSATGDFWPDDHEVIWQLGPEVPAALSIAARDCAYDAGEHCDVPGCELAGYETRAAMETEVERRCAACGQAQPSSDWLSSQGWCGRCFTAKAPEWLNTLRAGGAL